jgi:multidrug efflux system membrane fusion protein
MMNDSPIAAPALPPHVGRRFFSTKRVVIGGLLLIAIAAVVVVMRSRARAANEAAAAAARAITDRVIPVLTASAVRRDVPVWLDGLGSVSAFYTVTVRTLVDGRIDKVLFREGQHVQKGDALMQIDPRPFTIAAPVGASRARARPGSTQECTAQRRQVQDSDHAESHRDQQYTDQQAMVDQQAGQIAADQAQIGSAKLSLDYAHITSPIEGVVGIRLVDPGNVVHPTDATGLVVVTQLDPIAVFFTLPEDDLVAVQKAMDAGDVTVEARSRDGDTLLGAGKLAVVDNEINQATATIRLKAIFDNGKSEPFIRRPVATTLLMIGLLLAGMVGLPRSSCPSRRCRRSTTRPSSSRRSARAVSARRHDGVESSRRRSSASSGRCRRSRR